MLSSPHGARPPTSIISHYMKCMVLDPLGIRSTQEGSHASSALEVLSQQLDGRHQQSHRSREVSSMASRWQWLWTGPRLIGGWVGALRDPGPLMSALPCLPPAPATHPQHDKRFASLPTPAFLLPHFIALPFLF